MMPEAFCEPWQGFEGADGVERQMMAVAACAEMGLNVISSQALMQGMAANIPLSREALNGVYNMGARHLQLLRSIPIKSLKSTLVGMKSVEHVRGNLEVIQKQLLSREEFFAALGPIRRRPYVEDEIG